MARSISTFTSAIHATLPAAVRKNTVVSANIGNIGGKVHEVHNPPVQGVGNGRSVSDFRGFGGLRGFTTHPLPFPFCAASVRGRRFHLALLMETIAGGSVLSLGPLNLSRAKRICAAAPQQSERHG